MTDCCSWRERQERETRVASRETIKGQMRREKILKGNREGLGVLLTVEFNLSTLTDIQLLTNKCQQCFIQPLENRKSDVRVKLNFFGARLQIMTMIKPCSHIASSQNYSEAMNVTSYIKGQQKRFACFCSTHFFENKTHIP